jgi:hypothetical protein
VVDRQLFDREASSHSQIVDQGKNKRNQQQLKEHHHIPEVHFKPPHLARSSTPSEQSRSHDSNLKSTNRGVFLTIKDTVQTDNLGGLGQGGIANSSIQAHLKSAPSPSSNT